MNITFDDIPRVDQVKIDSFIRRRVVATIVGFLIAFLIIVAVS
jgi:hypothetical protein